MLIGASGQMVETLKRVEAAGVDEVILYFNVGLKNHQQTKDERARFMSEVTPHFASSPEFLEASEGIEPPYKDLQSSA